MVKETKEIRGNWWNHYIASTFRRHIWAISLFFRHRGLNFRRISRMSRDWQSESSDSIPPSKCSAVCMIYNWRGLVTLTGRVQNFARGPKIRRAFLPWKKQHHTQCYSNTRELVLNFRKTHSNLHCDVELLHTALKVHILRLANHSANECLGLVLPRSCAVLCYRRSVISPEIWRVAIDGNVQCHIFRFYFKKLL